MLFRSVDMVVTKPMYLLNFDLTKSGYNDGGPGYRIVYVGGEPWIIRSPDTVNRFLDAMPFKDNASRTNALAAALTVMLRNHFPGQKPFYYATANKSHVGKDTLLDFATGSAPATNLSYETTDWAMEKAFVQQIKSSPTIGVEIGRAHV